MNLKKCKSMILAMTISTLLLTNLIFIILIVILQNQIGHYERESKPKTYKNVLFIVADDLGWSDLGYGGQEALTPTIDRLANQGVKLNYSYTYSMCTPSRASILTGQFAEKTGLHHFVLSNSNPIAAGLPFKFSLMPQYLKKYGYVSHLIGKWHLGSCNLNYTPVRRGFHSFFGFFYGEEDYYTHRVRFDTNTTGLDFWNQTMDHLEPVLDKNGTYSTDVYVKRATEIIENHDKSKPLFLFYSAQNPHSDENFNVPKEYEDKYKHVQNKNRAKILGMISMLDDSINKIINSLESRDLLKDTIIFFTSDNGGEIFDYQRNYPLRGGKTTVFEGGHRVRAFINSNLLVPFTYDGMFHSVDWLPTVMSAALNKNIEIEGIDGKNQWDAIKNNLPSKRSSFIYNIDPIGSRHFSTLCNTSTESIREGDWKLIVGCPGILTDWYNTSDFNHTDPTYPDRGIELSISTNNLNCIDESGSHKLAYFLFNIRMDPYERTNLAAKYPCLIRSLKEKLDEYKTSIVVEPLVKEPLEKYRNPNANPKLFGDKWSPGWC